MTNRKRRSMGAVAVVVAAVAAQLLSAMQALGGDDVYVLENLRSGVWSRRLFAFNLDTPTAGYSPWWTGQIIQRRFIRVPASALLWLESELFGLRSVPYHLVTLALVAGSCLLLFLLLSRRAPVTAAAMVSVTPALHPAASEIVSGLSCQPIATAGLFSLGAVVAWRRMRERPTRGALGLVVILSGLAVTSYEAAVVLPVFLLLGDVSQGRRDASIKTRWSPRLAVLCILIAYVPWAIEMRRGLVAPDTTPVRPLSEVLVALRYDSVEYVCKAFGLLDPLRPTTYWFHERVGEAPAVATAVVLLAAAVCLARRSKLGAWGAAGFVLFLAPPLLTRATVSALNFPTLRQLYLPLLMGAPLLMLLMLAGARFRLRVAIPMVAWIAALAVESVVAGGTLDGDREMRRVTDATERILAGVPVSSTVVGVGDNHCHFAPSLVWPGPSLLGIPGYDDDPGPRLTAADDRTVIARSAVGFQIRAKEEFPAERDPGANRGPAWNTAKPVELAARGTQRITSGTVTIEEREGDRLTALRYRFDGPLAELVFIRFRGCSEPERMVVGPMP